MIVLGLHAFTHDSACALSVDGSIAAYGEEERFSRVKGDPSFPSQAIQFCLKDAGIHPGDIDLVTLPFRPRVGAIRRLSYLARRPLSFFAHASDLITKGQKMLGVERELGGLGISADLTFVDHYLSHALAVFLSSPFEEAAVMVLDGVAEAWSGALYHARRGNPAQLQCLARFPFPDSLGLIYASVTEHLGFRRNCEEGKVMAMAALGDERYIDSFKKLVAVGDIDFSVDSAYFDFGRMIPTKLFQKRFCPPRREGESLKDEHFALAKALQASMEEACLKLASGLLRRTGMENLCFTGGLALNPSINGVLRRASGCRDLYCIPPGGDAGTVLGAALMHEVSPSWRLEHPYRGYEPSKNEIQEAAARATGKVTAEGDALYEKTAELLHNGMIGGWCRGRAEMGPRALGHRSILADPGRIESKERINREIKNRHDFQPLAPAIIPGRCGGLFSALISSPFMLETFLLSDEAARRLPAVTHVDRTSRIQTVSKGDASGLYDLLTAFEKRSMIAALLNTSLNLKGEPLANSADDAVSVFNRGELDFLVLGDLLIERGG